MSELTWHERLHHLRFSRMVLLMEKWFSIFIICWLLLVGVATINLWIIGAAFALMYIVLHQNHHNLEDAAGLPVQHLVLRY